MQRPVLSKRPEPYTQAEHLRLAMEDLGTTFIKLGQILSTRPDLLPPAYIAQFSLLQDSARSISYAQVREIVETELGRPLGNAFKSFDAEPRASASIGQVHAARLINGLPVVVKVQRPGVEALVEEDLEILRNLARTASKRTEFGAYYDLEGWVEEFAFVMLNELDYIPEGRNADRIRTNFAGDDRIHVPEIHWDYSTGKVLTMEEIVGIKINDFEAADQAGLGRHRIAENTAHILLTMTYGHGFFHADPHPGNLFVLPGEAIGLIDYGMVGRLHESLRYTIVRIAVALIRKDLDRLVDELAMLGIARAVIRREALKRDLDHFIQRFYDKPLKEIVAAQAFNELVSLALRYRLQLPSELIVLFKVIAMSEGLGLRLDPDFKLMEFAEPYFKRFWGKKLLAFEAGKKDHGSDSGFDRTRPDSARAFKALARAGGTRRTGSRKPNRRRGKDPKGLSPRGKSSGRKHLDSLSGDWPGADYANLSPARMGKSCRLVFCGLVRHGVFPGHRTALVHLANRPLNSTMLWTQIFADARRFCIPYVALGSVLEIPRSHIV